jgi:hypothetical protein
LPREGLVKLKQGAVARVGIGRKNRVGKVRTQPIGVLYGDHLVVDSVHDKGWMQDVFEVREALTGKFLPVSKAEKEFEVDRWRSCFSLAWAIPHSTDIGHKSDLSCRGRDR